MIHSYLSPERHSFLLRLENDSLVRLQEFQLSGTWPRSMAIRDNVMVVIDQHGDTMELVRVDNETGMLSSTGKMVATPAGPSFVDFMD